tara:strand:- start:13377 stop:13481 length:105 start_codon:yes stop_codon:yes gene_type:complete
MLRDAFAFVSVCVFIAAIYAWLPLLGEIVPQLTR